MHESSGRRRRDSAGLRRRRERHARSAANADFAALEEGEVVLAHLAHGLALLRHLLPRFSGNCSFFRDQVLVLELELVERGLAS